LQPALSRRLSMLARTSWRLAMLASKVAAEPGLSLKQRQLASDNGRCRWSRPLVV